MVHLDLNSGSDFYGGGRNDSKLDLIKFTKNQTMQNKQTNK